MCRCCGYHCGSQLTFKCVSGYPGNWVSESTLALAEVLGITLCLRLKNVYTILVAASALSSDGIEKRGDPIMVDLSVRV